MHMIAAAIILAIILSGALGVLLLMRQAAAVRTQSERVPAALGGQISLEEHKRAAAYTLARTRLGIAKTIFDTILTVLWLVFLLGPLYSLVAVFVVPGILRSVAVVLAFALAERLLHLPFSVASTFWLETKFGFNRQTPLMFVRDRIKGAALSLALGVPLLCALFLLPQLSPSYWWLAAWAGFAALALAMSVIIPAFIAPMFNKFTPMPEGPLKERIEALLARCGFESKGLYVMDASRRSSHGNAYFAGFGRAKRIVFFDTLLQNHAPDEILSILAHELGHYKLGHIRQRMAEAAVLAFFGFAILGFAFADGGFANAFGLPPDPALILIVVSAAMGPALHLLSPLTSHLSRRAEYQADSFAKAMTGPAPLISALIRLARDNLSTLTPDALYARFYYSHPPVSARIARLKAA
ncbi:MAG: M48 family metallopeptidase [Methylocapsa sp.]|nr:M48 family metallopeptidase [Methylocapsa sp.]